jgi:hypothetical protein
VTGVQTCALPIYTVMDELMELWISQCKQLSIPALETLR